MPIRPRLDEVTAAHNLREIEPPMSLQEAVTEANRCLYCFDAPCIHACPTGIDVPSFIKKIANGQTTGAARTILRANVLGSSCARVCPTAELCEGACVMVDRDAAPIAIGRLQRYATDHVFDNGIAVLEAGRTKSGKRIAVVGAGPAGLSCAAELAQLGHAVTVFERKPEAGGLNTYGIAYYKMKPRVSLAEVELVRSLGVEIRTGVSVGSDVSPDSLRNDFDAVFLGVGLGSTRRLGIPGEDLPEVVEALAFIESIRTRPLGEIAVGERVVVIGCGNTAIDAVTQAKRLGAREATIVYRRGEGDMPAYEFEYEIGKNDGAGFIFDAAPIAVLDDDSGHVTGVRLVRTRATGAGTLEFVPGSETVLPCDMVIPALGQTKPGEALRGLWPTLELEGSGAIRRDFETGRTSIEGIWAGGDAANGGAEVVDAVGEGKRAARDIHRALVEEAAPVLRQSTRAGVPIPPAEAGLAHPVRVAALEAAHRDGASRDDAATAQGPWRANRDGRPEHG